MGQRLGQMDRTFAPAIRRASQLVLTEVHPEGPGKRAGSACQDDRAFDRAASDNAQAELGGKGLGVLDILGLGALRPGELSPGQPDRRGPTQILWRAGPTSRRWPQNEGHLELLAGIGWPYEAGTGCGPALTAGQRDEPTVHVETIGLARRPVNPALGGIAIGY